jgi:hypothetical protein
MNEVNSETVGTFLGVREMKGKVVAFDFETAYDSKKGYSLRNMTPHQYVNDTRFDPYLVAIVSDLGEKFVGRPELFYWGTLEGATLVAHNAAFDGMVLKRLVELGKVDDFKHELICTADMCAYLNRPRNLKDASKLMLGREMSKVVRAAMDGRSFESLNAQEVKDLLNYASDDAINCLDLYIQYGSQFPQIERDISKSNRDAGWRGIAVDLNKVEEGLKILEQVKWNATQQLPWTEEGRAAGSTQALAAHAASLGLPVPKSFKKDDPGMMEWVAKYAPTNPFIKARLDLASVNPHIARLESLKAIASTDGIGRFSMLYHGAHTGRSSASASGDESSSSKYNILNLPRQSVFGVDMRAMLKPREGYVFAIYDYSQVEARILQWIAGNKTFLDIVKSEGNIYQATAKLLKWYPMDGKNLKKNDPGLYQLSKGCTLGLGFNMSAAKFMLTCAKTGTILPCYTRDRWDFSRRHMAAIRNNFNLNAKEITNEKDEVTVGTYFATADIVDQWRSANSEVVDLWHSLQDELERAARKNVPVHTFTLPSGRIKRYFKPHFVAEARKFIDPETGVESTKVERKLVASTIEGRMPSIFHGGPLTENIVQATARDILFWGVMDIVKETNYAYGWNAYDEVIFEVPKSEGEAAMKLIPEKLCHGSSSEWTEGLPLEVEGGLFDHYTK